MRIAGSEPEYKSVHASELMAFADSDPPWVVKSELAG